MWPHEQILLLREILGTSNEYRVVSRNNPSTTQFPSDFALVHVFVFFSLILKLIFNRLIKHGFLNDFNNHLTSNSLYKNID